ncbi:hypothetical protein COLO4_05964 [Corchorus olitorius]|uniref:Uncharacterized protein n=1 Tax=Corchorus olitorius TaxID=93759 RepID=A0A1R3KPG4_9ROSI|nr:hypothetical protein COLO4_05964 [Corchorus olitorius]
MATGTSAQRGSAAAAATSMRNLLTCSFFLSSFLLRNLTFSHAAVWKAYSEYESNANNVDIISVQNFPASKIPKVLPDAEDLVLFAMERSALVKRVFFTVERAGLIK